MIAAAMGWIGTVGSISAYLLLSRGRWQATSLRYSTLNFLAGLLAGSASAVYGAWPSVASNLLWSLISVQAGVSTFRERRRADLAARHARERMLADLPAPQLTPCAEPTLRHSAVRHAC